MLACTFNWFGFNRLFFKQAVISPEQEEQSSWVLLVRSVVTQFCRHTTREAVGIPHTCPIMGFCFLQSLIEMLHQWWLFPLWSLSNILRDQIWRCQKDKDFCKEMKGDMSFPKTVAKWIAQSGQHQRRNQTKEWHLFGKLSTWQTKKFL